MCAQDSLSKASSSPKHWTRRGAGCLLLLILIPLVYYGLYFILRGQLASDPQLIAHQGGPAHEPENTLCPMAEMVILNPWMIRQAHAEEREVFVWFGVIEHPVVMRFILALGEDGLMVDDPAALAEILDR